MQRLIQAASGTVAGDGSLTLVFPATPLGSVWTGVVSLPTAPSSAIWTAQILGSPWGTWAGSAPFGPIQSWGGEQLTIIGTNLPPGYVANAQWTGTSEDEAEDSPTPVPIPNSPLINLQVPFVGQPQGPGNTGITTLPGPSGTVLPRDGINSGFSTKAYNVSNYQSVDILFRNMSTSVAGTDRIAMYLIWYDSNQSINVITPTEPNPFQEGPYIIGQNKTLRFRTPVKTPFLQVALTARTYTTTNYQFSMRGLATPLGVPVCALIDATPFIQALQSPGQLIIDTSGLTTTGGSTAIGSGGALVQQLQAYFGLALLWFYSGNAALSAPYSASIQQILIDGTPRFVTQSLHTSMAPQNNANDTTLLVYIPPGDCFIYIYNGDSVAHGFFASLTALI
jgi:hypothetical protein